MGSGASTPTGNAGLGLGGGSLVSTLHFPSLLLELACPCWTIGPYRGALGALSPYIRAEELWGVLPSGNVCSSGLLLLAGEVKPLAPSLNLLAWNPVASAQSGPFFHPAGCGKGPICGLICSEEEGPPSQIPPVEAWGRAPSCATAAAPSPCPCVFRVSVRGPLDVFGVGSVVWQEGATSSDIRLPS